MPVQSLRSFASGAYNGLFGGATACVILIGAALSSADAQPLQEAAAGIVGEERHAADAPALSAILLRDGQILAHVVDGHADPAMGIDASLDTGFPAGSVTKILTAALVMTEVDAGRLDLDAPIAEHIPADLRPMDADGAEVEVTLRQLLSHSSGLPVTWDGFPPYPPVESREAYIAASRTIVHPPGDRLVYSNVGFVLAGEVAAASAGMTFEDLAQDRLLTPLGMTQSSLGRAEDYDGPLAAGHARAGDMLEPEPHLDLTALAAAGSLLTTPGDLARLATMFLNDGVFEGRRILSAAAVDEMMTMQARAHPDLDEGFGLGFGVRMGEAGRKVWWDGTTTWGAAHFALYPDSGTAVIAMTNVADNHPTSVSGRRLLELAIPDLAAGPPPDIPIDEGIDGYYLAIDLVDPDLWFFAYAMPLRVQSDAGSARLTSGLTDPLTLIPSAPQRFRVNGGILDGATALATGDLLQVGLVRAERLPALLTPPALMTYAGALVLAVLFGLWLGIRAVWRRFRRACAN
ncbi:serine hydrolase [Roseobacter sp. HKCCD9010]|uniref:serine hydrolase domain-containing protein n=1 Tax=unclassified Roseobacter TaxID=196798 RepID=UPI0014916EBF|nr:MULTISPECIES: serine hydrolase domain-containing protein [unclassified Roseobacter]MBF9051616.1 serine hydrolase [Rhodobacterales bacterium HKCCD4356]NNV13140.1 serine hydrolase [Roseobacter sp. HKCCD7357]NNV17391.1 serine hydrolase [Roseobacter sp. HKCCD8768]NNV26997.1 serine hydrolase [Roseobacter sp. HKCCD8192]NNV31117.1 serine hydrolase [Roseobacter sp. HKCCD9061]